MRSCSWWLAVVVITSACKKASEDEIQPPTRAPRAHAEADELWALAPPSATSGLVITPTALKLGEHAWTDITGLVKNDPALAMARPAFTDAIQDAFGHDLTSLADVGLDGSKGIAVFDTPAGGIGVLAISDRTKFLAAFRMRDSGKPDTIGDATCKRLGARLACADNPQALDGIGTGKVPAGITKLGERGEIEGVFGQKGIELAAVAQLDPGQAVVRGTVTAPVLPPPFSNFGKSAKARIVGGKTAGFVAVDLGTTPSLVPDIGELVPGVDAKTLAKSVKGPFTMTFAGGTVMGDGRLPLSDTGPAKKLLELCPSLVPPAMRVAGAGANECKLQNPELPIPLEVWLDGSTLRIGDRKGGTGPAVALTPLGQELAAGTWTATLWGRGTMFGSDILKLMPQLSGMPYFEAGLRGFSLFDETGIGVKVDGNTVKFVVGMRTLFANPPDLVAKILAVPVREAFGPSSPVKAMIAAAPNSNLAGDAAAGQSGLLAPMMGIGMLTAVAIPAFLDYSKKAKKSEASILLNNISKNAKREYADVSEFPKGVAATLPAGATCCGQAGGGTQINNKCPVDTAAWRADPVWQALDFSIAEPTQYRYTYSSVDGQSFTAQAIGDLDCDGVYSTWIATGVVTNGIPEVTITPPPKGVY